MKRTLAVLSLACLLWSTPANAGPILNGGFEAGFLNWTTAGLTSIETAAFGSGPTEGALMARMSSGNGAEVGAISDAALEVFFGLPAGTLDALVTTNDLIGATEGSGILQAFTANAGDVLSFDWNFLTSELTPISDTNDTAFWVLSPIQTVFLADTFSAFVPSLTVLDEETGFATVNFVIPADGMYTLGFGVVDVSDSALGSVLLVDNVALSSVPEPATILLLGAGTVGVAIRRRASRARG